MEKTPKKKRAKATIVRPILDPQDYDLLQYEWRMSRRQRRKGDIEYYIYRRENKRTIGLTPTIRERVTNDPADEMVQLDGNHLNFRRSNLKFQRRGTNGGAAVKRSPKRRIGRVGCEFKKDGYVNELPYGRKRFRVTIRTGCRRREVIAKSFTERHAAESFRDEVLEAMRRGDDLSRFNPRVPQPRKPKPIDQTQS